MRNIGHSLAVIIQTKLTFIFLYIHFMLFHITLISVKMLVGISLHFIMQY